MNSRRRWLGGALRLAAVSVYGAGLPLASASVQARHGPFKGVRIRLSAPDHPHHRAMLRLLPQFTRETGIAVEADLQPLAQLKALQRASIGRERSEFDLIAYNVMWKAEYAAAGLLRPLEPLLTDAALADPTFDIEDVAQVYLENAGMLGGPRGYLAGPGARLVGLPYGAETSILAYRSDLFRDHGWRAPKNYTQLAALLPEIRDRTGLGALATRGRIGHNAVHAWLLHLNPMGGQIFDEHWAPVFQQDPGVRALEFLRTVVDTGVPESVEFDQEDMLESFLIGRTAMYLDSTLIFAQVRDAAASRIAGKVGFALHPGDVRFSSQSGGLGLGIPVNAQYPQAAFLLLQWLTAREQDVAVVQHGGQPGRVSTMANIRLYRTHPELVTLRQQIGFCNPDWRPIVPVWDEINQNHLGVAVSAALTGQARPAEALASVTGAVHQLMQSRGGAERAAPFAGATGVVRRPVTPTPADRPRLPGLT